MERSAKKEITYIKLIEPHENQQSQPLGEKPINNFNSLTPDSDKNILQEIGNLTKTLGGDMISRYAPQSTNNNGFTYFHPPSIIEIILIFTKISATVSLLQNDVDILFKWLKNRLGRRIKLKSDEFEIQINDTEDVVKALSILHQIDKSKS